MNEQDITGMLFTVQKSADEFKMSSDDWYPATLTSIIKYENDKQKFGPMLNWNFDLEGDEYTMEFDGEKKQRRVQGSTSMSFTPKSKLYAWYTKFKGSEPQEGEQVSLKPFIGIRCFIMVEGKPSIDKRTGKERTYYNVEKIKLRTDSAQSVKPVVQSVAAKPVTPAQPKVVEQVVVEAGAKSADIFGDVF